MRKRSMSGPESRAKDPLIGAVFGGKYELIRCVGSGGMGAVYEARNTTLGRTVAVKVLTSPLIEPERFVQEAQAASRVDTQHVVRIIDCDEQRTSQHPPYIVMELLHGESLRERLARVGRLDYAETLKVMRPIMLALARLHEHEVIHRDLKPDNIFLHTDRDAVGDASERPVLVDFGIAKLRRADVESDGRVRTGSQTWLGTIGYSRPDRSSLAHAGTDQFSAGIIVYECLAGRNPLLPESGDLAAYGARVCRFEDHLVPIGGTGGIPAGVDAIIRRMLAPEAKDQFPSMEAAANALAAVSQPVAARERADAAAIASEPASAPKLRTSRAAVNPVAVALGLALAGAGVGYWALAADSRASTSPSALPAVAQPSVRVASALARAATKPAEASVTEPAPSAEPRREPARERRSAEPSTKTTAAIATRRGDLTPRASVKTTPALPVADAVDVQLERLLDENERQTP